MLLDIMQLLDVNQAARVGPHGLERGLLGEVLPRVRGAVVTGAVA